MSLFYKINKTIGFNNIFMPFSEKELNCNKNDLLIENNFDFRKWIDDEVKPYMSKQAKDFYDIWLEIYKFFFKVFTLDNSKVNIGHSTLKDSLLQGKVVNENFKVQLQENTNNVSGFTTRLGKNSKWSPSVLDKLYNVGLFTEQDKILLELCKKLQDNMINCGIISQYMSCWR
jgi:hypothetical protein